MRYARTGATGSYEDIQSGNAAVYMKSTFSPSSGAGAGIAAICLQFIFTIVFAKKTNWSAVFEGSTSESNPITSL